MRIGELANQTGVSVRLLRYYEQQRLLRPVRLVNGYRDFAEDDVARVARIRRLLSAGIPTVAIRDVAGCLHGDDADLRVSLCPALLAVLYGQRERISEAERRLAESSRVLDGLMAGNMPGASVAR